MSKDELLDKCVEFSIKINKLRKYLREKQHELAIAQKEAHETIYWLRVLYGSELIPKEQYDDLMTDVQSLHKILSASVATLKNNENK